MMGAFNGREQTLYARFFITTRSLRAVPVENVSFKLLVCVTVPAVPWLLPD